MIEILNGILTQLHNAMDEIDDVADNEAPKSKALKYMIDAEMTVNNLMDDIETEAIIDGTKSGAV